MDSIPDSVEAVTDSVRTLAAKATHERSETAITMVRHRWLDRLAKAKVSQERFASEVGITPRALSNYVCGHRVADEDVALLADAAVLRLRAKRAG